MSDSRGSSGIGVTTIITIIFIVLKLIGVIDWSWFLVLLPALIGTGSLLLIMLILPIYYVLQSRRRRK